MVEAKLCVEPGLTNVLAHLQDDRSPQLLIVAGLLMIKIIQSGRKILLELGKLRPLCAVLIQRGKRKAHTHG